VNASLYAKPVIPPIIVRPALATLVIHALLVTLLMSNWEFNERDTVRVKPAPRVINAKLVDISDFQPKPKPVVQPKPAPKPAPRPAPRVVETPKPKPVPKPAPKVDEKPKPVVKAEPKPAPRPEPRMTAAQLSALARAELSESVAAQEQTATADELVSSFAALIRDTVVRYWSRPPSARNGMVVELQLQLIPTGEVVSVQIIRSSGNTAFDRSAQNAVEKAGSFPELQQLPSGEFEKSFRKFKLVFRPEDLRY
jgi:colicin import membrane protein